MGWSSLLGGAQWGILASAASGHEAVGLAALSNQILMGSTAAVIAVALILAYLGRKELGVVSTGWGAVFEHVYDFVNDMSHSFMGERGERYTPFAMSVFLFVLLSNWSGLLPVPGMNFTSGGHSASHLIFETPTASYNTTLALAVVSFLAFTFYGLKQRICGDPIPEQKEKTEAAAGEESGAEAFEPEKGRGLFVGFFVWLAHYLGPVPSLWKQFSGVMRYGMVPLFAVLFCFLNVVEELARLLSLSFRLYGNIFGEHQVKSSLLGSGYNFLSSAFVSGASGGTVVSGVVMCLLMWLISLFVTFIGTLAGFIQAFVFCILTVSYIGHVVAEEE